MKAIIFAAGLGTRIQTISKGKPKALLELENKPLLAHAIEYLIKYGVKSIIVNVHHQADMIEKYINNSKYASIITISNERKTLLDTGGGLLKSKSFFKNERHFIAFNVDVITNLNLNKMLEYHLEHEALATLAVRNRKTSRYLIFNKNNAMIGWKNTNTNECILHTESESNKPLAFSGIHILSSRIWSFLEKEKREKFSITPSYIRMSKSEKIIGFEDSSEYWFDVGKPETYTEVKNYLSKH